MRCSTDVSAFKPELEHLEDRIQPSFILSGGIGLLEAPVGKAVTDMQNAVSLLSSDLASLKASGTQGSAERFLGFSISDYTRIVDDHAWIVASVNADTNFINAVAMSEFTESGDIVDIAILKIPFLTNLIKPLGALTNDLSMANSIFNNGQLTGSLTTDINASPTTLNALLADTTPIINAPITPVLS